MTVYYKRFRGNGVDKWDQRFMDLAKHIAGWSRDPSTKVGAVAVDSRKRLVASGFNGLSRRIDDSPERLNNRDLRMSLTVHAEINLLVSAERSLRGCTVFVYPMPPCAARASALIQAGISRVVAPAPAPDLADRWGESIELAVMAMREAGVKVDILEGRY